MSVLAFALSGCFGSQSCAGGQGVGGQSVVCNEKNTFSYGLQGGSTTKHDSYAWQNTHTRAQVGWGTQLGSGSVGVVILDGAGKQVYARTVTGPTQAGEAVSTDPGAAGSWTIRIDLVAANGQVGVTVTAA